MTDTSTDDPTPWWLLPVLVILNPFSFLIFYGFTGLWYHSGWRAVMETFNAH